jgi:hypothetical protein
MAAAPNAVDRVRQIVPEGETLKATLDPGELQD